MKQFLLSALLLTFALCVCAQEHDHVRNHKHNPSDSHIFGHVINKQTDEHVAYMNVIVKGTSVATVTDASGHYFLNDLPAGTYTIAVYMVGYLSRMGRDRLYLEPTACQFAATTTLATTTTSR